MPIHTYLSDIIDHQRNIDYLNYKRIKGMIESAMKYKYIEEGEFRALLNKLNNKYQRL